MAASDFTNFLFNGSPPPAVTSETNATGGLPLWYSQYLSGLMNIASQQAAQPYQPYTGQYLAGFSDLQNQAFNQVQNGATAWQPYVQQGGNLVNQGSNLVNQGSQVTGQGQNFVNQAGNMIQQGANTNPSGIQAWMNPYNQNVTDAIQQMGLRNMNENLLPALQNQFIGSGGFGSGVDQTQTERLVRDVGQDISNQQAAVLNQGYNTAAGNYLTAQQQQIGAGQQLGGLGQTMGGLGQQLGSMGTGLGALGQTMGGLGQMQNQQNISSAGALEAAGAEQQNLQQQGLNLGLQNFQNQQQYPWLQISNLSNVLRGNQFPTSTIQTQTGPFTGTMSPSPLASMAGTAMLANSMGNNQATVP